MALAVVQTLAFQTSTYLGTNPLVSASVSLPANSLVIVATGSVSYLDTYHYANTPTNTGTALTWVLVNAIENDDGNGFVQSQLWYAKNTTAQTVTISVYWYPTGGYDVQRSLCGYVITGHNLTTPIGNTFYSGNLSLNVGSSNSLALLSITDAYTTALTSSNMVETTVSTASGTALLAYEPVASPGTFTASVSRALSLYASVMGEIKVAAGGTTYTASATSTTTVTGTVEATVTRSGAGSSTTTDTGTASADRVAPITGSSTVTVTGSANSTRVVSIAGTSTTTVTSTGGATYTGTTSGSSTITATGTSDGTIQPVVTIGGASTTTVLGLASGNYTYTLTATSTTTPTATATLNNHYTIGAVSTITITSETGLNTPGVPVGPAGLYIPPNQSAVALLQAPAGLTLSASL